jgi:putative transposase
MAPSDDTIDKRVSYFVTVRTFNCKSVFGDEANAAALVDTIETIRRRVGFKKYGYVVLPDHYHLLLGGGAGSRPVVDLIMAINHAVARLVELPDDGQPLWDDEADVLVIYTPQGRFEKLNYIHSKPVLCGIVERAEDYAFSSAGFYFKRYGKTQF